MRNPRNNFIVKYVNINYKKNACFEYCGPKTDFEIQMCLQNAED